ncbi:hypothetical protein AVO45_14900 [Ruegeria marisrubri]|uniref:Uncharacterized protein n=1 Tax=Ruegeria marisrubri TaxID=1685379 RepID=A0A0X3TJJ2_9RHOB|nr:hypothetical protein AVO45_14900 [Ruegeria marisrubri]
MIGEVHQRANLLGNLVFAASVVGLGPMRKQTTARFAQWSFEADRCVSNYRPRVTSSDWGVTVMTTSATERSQIQHTSRGIFPADSLPIQIVDEKNRKPREGRLRGFLGNGKS